jgi:hypothetical protein
VPGVAHGVSFCFGGIGAHDPRARGVLSPLIFFDQSVLLRKIVDFARGGGFH